ncbi:TerB family tellurite resistance protein [Ostreiculturibacter nitratireducens]|uniref:tellurite resistance TerB family protein n=1 Tax=Ostreiculturibacter nitratireducens TaxID=3075226 RepID=UPI0031B646C0
MPDSMPTRPASEGPKPDWFDSVEGIVADPLRFKARLGIGERAYASLRLRNAAFEAWDVAGVAATGAAVAKSSAVASAFFASGGFWAWLGLGGAAVTPLGWVVAAGVVSGGAWFGITRFLKSREKGRVTVIPHFISTPLDVLALGLFDLLAPLALKLARADDPPSEAERAAITAYFTRGWGYDAAFVAEGLDWTESHLAGHSTARLARDLARFKRENPDCDAAAMSADILDFLRTVAEADGPLTRAETRALERIDRAFAAEGGNRLSRGARTVAVRLGKFVARPFRAKGR